MEQRITTPLKPLELIIGKLTPYFVIGMLDVVLAVLMGRFLFDVPLWGTGPLSLEWRLCFCRRSGYGDAGQAL